MLFVVGHGLNSMYQRTRTLYFGRSAHRALQTLCRSRAGIDEISVVASRPEVRHSLITPQLIATSGISCRITCIVVPYQHQSQSQCLRHEKRGFGLILIKGDQGIEHFQIKGAAYQNMQVRHITVMSPTRHHAVARIGRIEMPAC